MIPRIALVGFLHETNTFAPLLTHFSDFAQAGGPYATFLRGDEVLQYRGQRFNRAACGFINQAEALGHAITPILFAAAEPSNQVTADAFAYIMGEIEAGLREKEPFDGLFLDLHGAMVTQDYIDGETEVLRRCRAIMGDVPIAVALDLHGNITWESFALASVMVGYRSYPHTDVYETGVRCAELLDQLLRGVHFAKSFRAIPFLMPLTKQSTNTEPNRSIYNMLPEMENAPGVHSCSYLSGFAPADMAHTGPTVFAYADNQAAADQAADALQDAILARECDYSVDLLSPEAAVAAAMNLAEKNDRPVILADIQDNAGAGGTSDTPFILQALVDANAPRTALGLMNDPQAAAAAHAAGEGAQIRFDLGGKLTAGQKPFPGTFTVKKLFEGEFTATGPMFNGMRTDFGKMANLKIGNVEVVVVSSRAQANDQSFFRVVGIEPSEMDILVLKSSNHYRADFEPIASAIIAVDAPGAFYEDARQTPYRNLRKGVRLFGCGPTFQ